MPRLAIGAAALVLALPACHAAPRADMARSFATPAAAPATADPLRRDLDALLAQPALARAFVALSVRSLTRHETVYARDADKLMMPASTMKIATLAAAAQQLGWDFTYDTQLVALGPVDGGVLNGDLVVVGSGDPSIDDWDGEGSRLFSSWADRLKSIGVTAIAGRIVGDDNAFDDEELGFGWSWDDLAAGFAAGVSALQFNESSVQVTVAPGPTVGSPATVRLAPATGGLDVRSTISTGPASGQTAIQRRRLPGSQRLDLRGSIVAGSPPVTQTVSVDNPTLFFVSALRSALIAAGIDVTGPAVDIDDLDSPPRREEGTVLATHRSPPLSMLAVTLMKLSQNQFAETLLKTLGARASAPTAAGGRNAVRTILQGWDIGPSELLQADGSGLSRYNYVTAAALVRILEHVARDDRLRAPFDAALPVAGRDGTLETRMKGTAAEANARVKTGSMSNVRAAAGYVRTRDDDQLVFAILVNNFDGPGAGIVRVIDDVIARLASSARR
jgi:serine-type D-Ala-D-Ala carboxypeptidase/endopeptidase (penicillin-binding protein 4)